ncbi:MAG: hypothetical protein OEY09_06990 [Gammaproteobacteria bacterium]|nr:hypothetical protein [Gammaproteobacteria bacterium]
MQQLAILPVMKHARWLSYWIYNQIAACWTSAQDPVDPVYTSRRKWVVKQYSLTFRLTHCRPQAKGCA